jgi:hypothetical protein
VPSSKGNPIQYEMEDLQTQFLFGLGVRKVKAPVLQALVTHSRMQVVQA